METRITASELARNLSDILSRVRYRRERFRVERNGEVVAEIIPVEAAPKVFTVADFRRRFAGLRVPEGLGTAIEDAKKALGPMPEPPWLSS